MTPRVTQLPWTHNLVILTQSKRPEEREFYLRMAVQQRWGARASWSGSFASVPSSKLYWHRQKCQQR